MSGSESEYFFDDESDNSTFSNVSIFGGHNSINANSSFRSQHSNSREQSNSPGPTGLSPGLSNAHSDLTGFNPSHKSKSRGSRQHAKRAGGSKKQTENDDGDEIYLSYHMFSTSDAGSNSEIDEKGPGKTQANENEKTSSIKAGRAE